MPKASTDRREESCITGGNASSGKETLVHVGRECTPRLVNTVSLLDKCPSGIGTCIRKVACPIAGHVNLSSDSKFRS